MRNQEINVIINNLNLFIRAQSAQATSQNTIPRGQQIRDVFSQYRQLPREVHSQVGKSIQEILQQHGIDSPIAYLVTPFEEPADLEILQAVMGYFDSDRSFDDLVEFGEKIYRLAYIRKYGRSK
ncbi:hypothetical protein [Aggregatibacter kilianii]|uniref:hypothetical protein n=1 Tax=Aggregatibacter kilianii TaxID=2025884 RepID=UPI000D649507|nr:hypothetical protein [Aggregatibacter kilianii]